MTQAWTADLVRSHAQVCVAVELYTLPFYFTALTSIKDTNDPAYGNILGVCMEEMLHLEQAANLCLAVGTKPAFAAPVYGRKIEYLDLDDPETNQYALLNANLGPLDAATLETMLTIESPEEFTSTVKIGPSFPYRSIGEMYNALLAGIQSVGWTNLYDPTLFVNQQQLFDQSAETIATLADATQAIAAICSQGEGLAMRLMPLGQLTMSDFPVPAAYQVSGVPHDPADLAAYAHFGRFINIKNGKLPETYTGVSPTGPLTGGQKDALAALQGKFAALIVSLNDVWSGSGSIDAMSALLGAATNCWTASVIPMWTAAQAEVTPPPRRARAAK